MTKNELIAQYKKEYPTLTRQHNDEVFELTAEEYEATIEEWATKKSEEITAENQNAAAKAALLAQLGITEEQAKLLLN
jgi:hypothetical protein